MYQTKYYLSDEKANKWWDFLADQDEEAKKIADKKTPNPYRLTAYAYHTPNGKVFFDSIGIKEREIGNMWLGDLHPAF